MCYHQTEKPHHQVGYALFVWKMFINNVARYNSLYERNTKRITNWFISQRADRIHDRLVGGE